jgi:hypothetical protein
MKLDLLTNATVVHDAMRFVNERPTTKKDRDRPAVMTQEEELETTKQHNTY